MIFKNAIGTAEYEPCFHLYPSVPLSLEITTIIHSLYIFPVAIIFQN